MNEIIKPTRMTIYVEFDVLVEPTTPQNPLALLALLAQGVTPTSPLWTPEVLLRIEAVRAPNYKIPEPPRAKETQDLKFYQQKHRLVVVLPPKPGQPAWADRDLIWLARQWGSRDLSDNPRIGRSRGRDTVSHGTPVTWDGLGKALQAIITAEVTKT